MQDKYSLTAGSFTQHFLQKLKPTCKAIRKLLMVISSGFGIMNMSVNLLDGISPSFIAQLEL